MLNFIFAYHRAPTKKNPSMSNDYVPRLDFEEKEQEVLAKDEQLQVSQNLSSFSLKSLQLNL